MYDAECVCFCTQIVSGDIVKYLNFLVFFVKGCSACGVRLCKKSVSDGRLWFGQ